MTGTQRRKVLQYFHRAVMFEHFEIRVDSYPSMPDHVQVILGRRRDDHVVRVGAVHQEDSEDLLGTLGRAIGFFRSMMRLVPADESSHRLAWKENAKRSRSRILDGDFDPVS